MSLQITVVTGKPEEKKAPAGLVRRTEAEPTEKHPETTIAELVSSVFAQIQAGIATETEVEVEISGAIELSDKEGKAVLTYDIHNLNPAARTMNLKFKSKIQPR